MKNFRRASLLLLFTRVVFAHDPYEITATASLFSNRTEVRAVLEYKAARLLAGLGWPTNEINHAAEFAWMTPTLTAQAEKFFQLTAAGENLRVQKSAVELGVENHVSFVLQFPPTAARPLTFAAPGLAALAPEGQYGVGLTVLDMVKMKVLGQQVFYAANPLATASFGSLTNEEILLPSPAARAPTPHLAASVPTPPTPALASAPTHHRRNLLLALFAIVFTLLLLRRR
ncbi:MAG: hypothetical protein RL380_638 [Verrucomicrobiota bacterium]|jgi:hypothetical protein